MIRPTPLLFSLVVLALSACGPQEDQQEEIARRSLCFEGDSIPAERYFHSQSTGQVIQILPDTSHGGAFRKLVVLSDKNCSLQDERVLPSDVDQPIDYRLADLKYNSAFHFLGISGNGSIYCYRLDSLSLAGPFEPKFIHPTIGEDAQSGQIVRLELWEEFLVGYSEDYGPFAFDLRHLPQAEPISPFREWQTEQGRYHSLFLFPGNQEGYYQPIVPIYDQQTRTINLEIFFPEPVAIDLDKQPEPSRDGPIVQLIYSQGEVLEINMASGMAIQ